jgi:hypothetical protein
MMYGFENDHNAYTEQVNILKDLVMRFINEIMNFQRSQLDDKAEYKLKKPKEETKRKQKN